ncbi:MAG: hypothetical protein ISS23_01875 [Nanoarchaeota archaeon]|nr:hypothetical protein [Nanoarchaeota archaeon]
MEIGTFNGAYNSIKRYVTGSKKELKEKPNPLVNWGLYTAEMIPASLCLTSLIDGNINLVFLTLPFTVDYYIRLARGNIEFGRAGINKYFKKKKLSEESSKNEEITLTKKLVNLETPGLVGLIKELRKTEVEKE